MNTKINDYDYFLPPELVAQYPLSQRDASRLLILNRAGGEIGHASFRDLPRYLDPNDLLVLNDTRVFPARLHGKKASGGKIELLLHHLPEREGEEIPGGGKKCGTAAPGCSGAGGGACSASSPSNPPLKSARAKATYRGRLRQGQELVFGEKLRGEVISLPQAGVAEVRFRSLNGSDPSQLVMAQGEVPLPPYIQRSPEESDQERYQTVYASRVGAIACPTAGLHFTGAVMGDLAARGIETVSLTLHVGPGTFMPVREEDYTRHQLQPEYFELSQAAAQRLNAAKAQGKRLVAVGTTSVRVLEYCAGPQGFTPQSGWCDLYIHPGYTFRAVDRLLTNFHLPKSTLLLLVSAFAGRDLIMKAYEKAVKEKYRFYSYGDCMLIL
ncbi:MAG: tRNA preQ1(34) S-adenosylmethionine ribosyltransferase-isomerase QueA [Syntrophales bacterium]|nr:tRNA preQ1(34) S-adenosylmethionine ribosyltransferase-isomerase QueA [Syntrophales bacterium]